MSLNVRFDQDVVILSNFGRLLNDPAHFDAGRDVRQILDQGYRKFVLELVGIRDLGPTVLGLLTTLTRQIRQANGEITLARPSPATLRFLEEMRMDDYWDIYEGVEEAKAAFTHRR